MALNVELVSVERALWSGEATAVLTRTTAGELEILPGHAPLLGQLDPSYGVVRIDTTDGAQLVVAVHGGFISVTSDGVSLLAELAEPAEEIDADRARAALERARGGDSDDEEAEARALSRLRACGQTV